MNTLAVKPLAKKVIFEADVFWVELVDGRKLGIPLAYFPRLVYANEKQRAAYVIRSGGSGLHREEIDEDINVENLLLGVGDNTVSPKNMTKVA